MGNYKQLFDGNGAPFNGVKKSSKPCNRCGNEIYWKYVNGYFNGGGPRNSDDTAHTCGKTPKRDTENLQDEDDMGQTREDMIERLENLGKTKKELQDKNIKELSQMLAEMQSEEQKQREEEKQQKKQQEEEEQQRKEETQSEYLHEQIHVLLTLVKAGMHCALVGPAGSFKTATAHLVSKALGLNFESQSFCNQTSEAKLIGFVSAGGGIVETPFRQVFVNGGVFLSDEFDAANPNIGVVLNSASANGFCSFPDGTLYAHKDFRLILGMNTVGAGADRKYVGRNQLDAATRDRFAIINWQYDQRLEKTMAKILAKGEDFTALQVTALQKMIEKINARANREINPDKWTNYCHKTRAKSDEMGISERNVVASPRAVFGGIRLLQAGLTSSDVANLLIFNKLGVDESNRLREACPVPVI